MRVRGCVRAGPYVCVCGSWVLYQPFAVADEDDEGSVLTVDFWLVGGGRLLTATATEAGFLCAYVRMCVCVYVCMCVCARAQSCACA